MPVSHSFHLPSGRHFIVSRRVGQTQRPVARWFARPSETPRFALTDGMDPARLYTASGWAKDVLSNIRTKRGGSGMEITTIGIDLAKSVFAVSGADSSG